MLSRLSLSFGLLLCSALPAAAQLDNGPNASSTAFLTDSLNSAKGIILAAIERAAPICFTIVAVVVGVKLVMRLVGIVLH